MLLLAVKAVRNNTSGSVNIGIGKQALYNNTTANCNIGIGNRSLLNNVTGALNIAIGGDATLFTNLGSNNVGLGYFAGQASNGSYNLFLGTYAGAYQGVVSNMLVIDNSNGRTNTATELTNALITGTFAVAPANQYLRFNANVGIGVDATARLHVQGIDSLSTNYALKADNSSLSPLLYVRNDGNVGVGVSPTSNKFTIQDITSSNSQLVITSGGGATSFLAYSAGNQQLYFDAIYYGGSGGVIAQHTSASGIIWVSGQLRFCGNSGLTVGSIFSYNTLLNIDVSSGNLGIGIGTSSGLARLHVVGVSSTSSDYAMKVDNSISPLLYVRN